MSFNAFFNAYVQCALWLSVDNQDIPLDRAYLPSDISSEELEKMKVDCKKFYHEQSEAIELFDEEQMGHDFWLSRNGHGTGFWDGEYGDLICASLQKAARAYGECSLYIGDDGKIYYLCG